ncbi:ribonucleoside-triphosphate reductase, adenosylcobalamin-dependent [Mycobacterium paragordonae]|uniref:Adenosylcobalamin-dependent ribonucleoside-triphosphate reductase n=1 Tax=Mycobacterium paragordonae TaxID=1389713 RepID=A0AAJ1W0M1_9MYCO|nr:ribonucleoside-triphosphate reductase, adenosylcobalamin-dependent [Mycobacterium paragordonae]MDP7733683.1 ribonucleoside-triphosphate reductase, adenosylcobalamin-dependent [Mycobacterium paragordonae]
MTEINWGPTGELVYNRTYARTKPDGSKETWPETVERVVDGNLALVDERYQLPGEREDLIRLMTEFKIIPAGRHLWASGVKNAQHLFNCWVSGWTDRVSEHFEFTFLRLMEGGGVGANYSNGFLVDYPPVQQDLYVEIVCDEEHPDYEALLKAGVLSNHYAPDWSGAFVIEDSREGWASALVDLIDTHYRDEVSHYRRVYDVSRVRASGTKLRTFGGRASGPLPLAQMLLAVNDILSDLAFRNEKLTGIDAMDIDHAIAQCVVAGGVRRSARMAMMHWADHQIHDFINIKQQSGSHWTTNISVEVDEDFWRLVDEGALWANDIMEALSIGAVRNGEPGMWDSSASNVGEPNEVICTNPCGEITLEPWEPCNLGHINLAAFVTSYGGVLAWELYKAHTLMTRFLIRATFAAVGDPKSREVLDRNRRIGVGHLGVASFLAMRGMKYSEARRNDVFKAELRSWANHVDQSAAEFCHQLRIPVPVKKRTVAPTGTIAKMPGVSEGIHPIFSKHFIRRIRFNKNSDYIALTEAVMDGYAVEDDLYAPNTAVVSIPTKDILVDAVEAIWGDSEAVESADDLTLNELLGFQALYQQLWADNAVSFTANVDPERYQPKDVENELKTFAGLIKGSTIFPESSFPQAPYERITKEEYDAATTKAVSDGVDEECSNGSCPIR